MLPNMKSDSPDRSPTVICGIEFTASSIREIGPEASDECIAVSEIRDCRLRYGSLARFPKVQGLIGAGMASCILVVIATFMTALMNGRKSGFYLEGSLVFVSMLGAWLIHDDWRKHHYLEVITRAGVSKLRLTEPIDDRALATLQRVVAENFSLTR